MKILGIDPGIGIVGFGAIYTADRVPRSLEWGVITTHKDRTIAERLEEIYTDLSGLLSQARPDVVSLEKIFFARNTTTFMAVTQARGVIVLVCQQHGIPVVEYTPLQVKMALTGYGRADKREIQEQVKHLLTMEQLPKPDDAADALALALCHHQSHR